MDQALAMGARCRADLVEQRHRTLFEKARADAAQNIVRVGPPRITLFDTQSAAIAL